MINPQFYAMESKFKNKCFQALETIERLLNIESLVETKLKINGTIQDAISDIQTHVNSASNDLLYGSGCSLDSFLRELLILHGITNKNTRKPILGIGLASILRLSALRAEDRGIPKYYLWFGNPDAWEKHVSASCINESRANEKKWDDVKLALSNGVNMPERIFCQKNATGALLAFANSNIHPSGTPVLVVKNSSNDGAGKQVSEFRFKHPWALVRQTLDFPLLYAMVSRDSHPLGFFQIKFNIPNTLRNHDHFLSGDRGLPWLKLFNFEKPFFNNTINLLNIFCQYFLSKILATILELECRLEILSKQELTLPLSFINTVDLQYNGNPQRYKSERWERSLVEVMTSLHYGHVSPNELALCTMLDCWRETGELKSAALEMEKRAAAEPTLFWSERYREHFVHSLKVFLLGLKIIRMIFDDCFKGIRETAIRSISSNTRDDKKARIRLEELWMIAATVHDFSIPLEKLPKLQREYWETFLNKKQNDEYMKVEQLQARQALAECVFRDHIVSDFLHLMHFQTLGIDSANPKKSQIYKQINDRREKEFLLSDYLTYFLKEGDHGIASAFWLFNQCSVEKKDFPDDIMAVVHACYFHNLAMKVGEKGSLQFSHKKLEIDFYKNPITFILLLCDVLQDEGREESNTNLNISNGTSIMYQNSRPTGHIANIFVKNNKLNIDIEYLWLVWQEPAISINPTKTKLKTSECISAANSGAIVCDSSCDSTTGCSYMKKIEDHLEHLTERLKNFPVVIKILNNERKFHVKDKK